MFHPFTRLRALARQSSSFRQFILGRRFRQPGTLNGARAFSIALTTALCSSLSGCIDTDIRIDLRDPTETEIEVKAGLQEAAIDVLTLQYPDLRHGSIEERAKQLRTCEAFFSDEPRAAEVIRSAQPVQRDGVTIRKIVTWQNGQLFCGFNAQGPAMPVLTMLEGSDLINVNRIEDQYVVRINTQGSDYANVPDLGFFDRFTENKAPPTLSLTVLGNKMTSDYEPGQVSSHHFHITENLMGKRQHFQKTFEITVSARQPEITDILLAWWEELWLSIERWFSGIKQSE